MDNMIFWQTITTVDHSILTPDGEIVGNSFDLGAKVSGPLNGEEQVIIDFSAGKKAIKALVDGGQGLDHKLWVMESQITEGTEPHDVLITAAGFSIVLPRDAIYVYETVTGPDWTVDSIVEHELDERYRVSLEQALAATCPGIRVPKVFASRQVPDADYYRDAGYEVAYFRYSHGLPRSTSYGCQNPIHGHLSYIALVIDDAPGVNAFAERELLDDLFESFGFEDRRRDPGHSMVDNIEFPSIYFYREMDHVLTSTGGECIMFDTVDRGYRSIRWAHSMGESHASSDFNSTRWVATPEYSTIENLVQFCAERLRDLVAGRGWHGNYTLAISEGLNKGSQTTFTIEV